MITWTPIFSKIVDSSLWQEDDGVVKVFITMLAKKDADHVVRATAFEIARWANKSEAEVLAALRVLEGPDKKRLEKQEYEGRRIQRIEGGWVILNGEYYQKLMRNANRREYKRMKQREYRGKGKPLRGEVEAIKKLESGDRDGFDRLSEPKERPPA